MPRECPLVETHLHLEGSIPLRALRRLAARHGAALPRSFLRGGAIQRGRGFDAFMDSFVACVRLLRDRRDVREAATALFEDLSREGVEWAELAFSPQSHLRRGLPFHDLVMGLSEARQEAAARGGPAVALIADGGRLWGPGWLEEMADQAADYAGEGVVAMGLGGDERAFPARRFRRAFEIAARRGLRLVTHAGEGTPARCVREALEELNPERIGHGIGAASDRGLLEELAARGITLEICPTSNVMTSSVASAASHPLRRILEKGVRVTLGSDDRTIFGTTLRGEYRVAVEECGVPVGAVPRMIADGVRGSFAPAGVKRRLLRRLAAYSATRSTISSRAASTASSSGASQ